MANKALSANVGGVSIIGLTLLIILKLFVYFLLARIIIEMIASFSRNFQPPSWFSVLAEALFKFTDPPVNAARKFIPPLTLGRVQLDMSVMVLFLVAFALQVVVINVF